MNGLIDQRYQQVVYIIVYRGLYLIVSGSPHITVQKISGHHGVCDVTVHADGAQNLVFLIFNIDGAGFQKPSVLCLGDISEFPFLFLLPLHNFKAD